MFNQKLKNEITQDGSGCKITIEEIREFAAFKDLDEETLEELREFVYQISLILYKSNHNDTA